MEKNKFNELMRFYGEENGITFNEEQLELFFKYMNLLIEWNKKMNLTAIIDLKEIIIKHFIDSLTILNFIKDKKNLVDVGTGAGFPGIPLKIMDQNIEIVLVDSLNKRINFLNEVIKELDLENIKAIHSRVEEFGKNVQYREKFDIATSRAVANLSVLSEYLIPLVKINGECICMKGAEIEAEVNNSQKAIEVLGGNIENIVSFELPKTDMKRNIIIIEKIRKTPNKYPRKSGTPAKEPIK